MARLAAAGAGRPVATTSATRPPRRPTPARASAADSQPASPASHYFTPSDARPVMLYDGVCRMCSTGVDVALALDRGKKLRFAALQSPAGAALLAATGRAPDDVSSVVLVSPGDPAPVALDRSDAVLAIAKLLGVAPAALAALATPLPKPLRDGAYNQVADNRFALFGRLPELRVTQGGGAGDDGGGRFLVE